jgi:uncharacterized protein YjbI with pentapeptide repeats
MLLLVVVFGVALLAVLIAPGLFLWLPRRSDAGSRADLGASLLGGAVVAFSVLVVEVVVLNRVHGAQAESDRRAQRAALQLQLSLQNDFPGLDVAERDLSGFYLQRKQLPGARLVGANLNGVDLSHAELCRADLAGARLDYARLAGADLKDANLSAVEGWSVQFDGASLDGASLRNAVLASSTLIGASLRDADLRGANLNSCDLTRADLSGAQLEGTRLATLLSDEGAIWPDGFDPDAHGVTRIAREWAAIPSSRTTVNFDDQGRIVKFEVFD